MYKVTGHICNCHSFSMAMKVAVCWFIWSKINIIFYVNVRKTIKNVPKYIAFNDIIFHYCYYSDDGICCSSRMEQPSLGYTKETNGPSSQASADQDQKKHKPKNELRLPKLYSSQSQSTMRT